MLPPEYRDGLYAEGGTGAFWLTAYYGRLVAYLPEDWEKITEQLSRIPMPSPRLSHFKTKVIGLAQEMPVSYTHLDLYKRQAYRRCMAKNG